MTIKEIPVNYKTYYKIMRERAISRIEELNGFVENLSNTIRDDHKKVLDNKDLIKKICNVDIEKYSEFVNNEYTTGQFYKVTKGLFANRSNNYELVSELFDAYSLAINQKKLYDAKEEIKHNEKLSKLTLKEYNRILKVYYTQVHKELILEGKGYAFSGHLGWTCVNRCVVRNHRKMLDYAATKKREKELIAAGKRIYNKEEAAWCERNGIEYKAEDKRVYREDTHCYEVPLLGCKLPGADNIKLTMTDYRGGEVRGKSNKELVESCNNDTTKICELPIDLRSKITLCESVDKLLYFKLIRNENQEPITSRKANRKNR